MTQIQLCQPIEGKAVGEIVDVPASKARFYVALGYAKRAGSTEDHANGTGVKAGDDLTVAENREAPDEAPPTTENPTIIQRDNLGATQDAGVSPRVKNYDPAEHTVTEVLNEMERYPARAPRILELERNGKKRAGILDKEGSYLERQAPQGAVKVQPQTAVAEVKAAAPVAENPATDEQLHHNEPDEKPTIKKVVAKGDGSDS